MDGWIGELKNSSYVGFHTKGPQMKIGTTMMWQNTIFGERYSDILSQHVSLARNQTRVHGLPKHHATSDLGKIV